VHACLGWIYALCAVPQDFFLGWLILIALAGTIVFHAASIRMYQRPMTMISVHDATNMDLADAEKHGHATPTAEELRMIRESYLSPVFKVSKPALDDLFHEAAVTSGRIDGLSIEDVEQAIEDEAYESADEADDEQVQAALEAQTADVDATASANGASWLSWAKNPMFATSSTKAPKAA